MTSAHETAIRSRGWSVTLAGIGINLALGVLYTWSVIKKAIPSEWGWSDADKALPYSIACIVFAIVMVPAGRLQDRIGPRWVATAGGVLTGLGFVVASRADTLLWFVVGFGVLAGAGFGLGYAAATPPAVKWFPARKTGLVAGLVVAGFGLASVYISPIANHLTGFTVSGEPVPELELLVREQARLEGELANARARLSPEPIEPGAAEILRAELDRLEVAARAAELKDAGERLLALKERNIQRTLRLFGIGFLLVVVVLAQFLVAPPPGYRPPDGGAGNARAPAAAPDLRPGEILRTPLFYLLWTMYALAAGAGLMIIGNITTIARLGRIEAGFVLVALLAVGNAAGRVAAGLLSDRIGRPWTMFVVFVLQAGLMMALRQGPADMATFVVISTLLGFNYGACLSVFPSAVKDNFGLRNFGMNYGLVFTAWGAGGFVFPLLSGRLFEAATRTTGTGSYDDAYLAAAAALVFAAALTFATRIAEKRHKARPREGSLPSR